MKRKHLVAATALAAMSGMSFASPALAKPSGDHPPAIQHFTAEECPAIIQQVVSGTGDPFYHWVMLSKDGGCLAGTTEKVPGQKP